MKVAISIVVLLIAISLWAWLDRFSAIKAQAISGQELNHGFWLVAVSSSYVGAIIALIIIFASKRFRFIASVLFIIAMLLSPLASSYADHLSRWVKTTNKKTSNGPMDLTTGNAALSMGTTVAVSRSGTEAAKTKSSLRAFTPAALLAAPVPPVASHRGRWKTI